jgi:hypothetical protein
MGNISDRWRVPRAAVLPLEARDVCTRLTVFDESSVVRVTSMTVTLPETTNVRELESELVTAVADRLRDDHGYQLAAEVRRDASGTRNDYPMNPAGRIVVDKRPGKLKIKLHGVDVDARDLFTGISSELGLRHEGLRTEIG